MSGRRGTPIVIAVALAGCGSSHKATSSAASTPAASPPSPSEPSSATIPANAPPAVRLIASRLLRKGELAGFVPEGHRVLGTSARTWVSEEEVPNRSEQEGERKRLERLGFVAAARERLTPTSGGPAEAISVVVRFATPHGAAENMQQEARNAHGAHSFSVTGIPGAAGFGGTFGTNVGLNVAFTQGPFYYLVGAGYPTSSTGPSRQQLIAAAQRLYDRVRDKP